MLLGFARRSDKNRHLDSSLQLFKRFFFLQLGRTFQQKLRWTLSNLNELRELEARVHLISPMFLTCASDVLESNKAKVCDPTKKCRLRLAQPVPVAYGAALFRKGPLGKRAPLGESLPRGPLVQVLPETFLLPQRVRQRHRHQ